MTANKKAVNELFLLEDTRVAFAPSIFEKSSTDGGKETFNAKFIVEPGSPQAKALEACELRVAKEKWGDEAEKVLKIAHSEAKNKVLRDGDLQRSAGFEGMLFVSALNEERPSAFDRARRPVAKEDGVIYSGCYVNVRLEIWAQANKWGNCVRVKLLGVQFVRDGDAFGSGSKPAAADDFPDLDAGGVEDPFA